MLSRISYICCTALILYASFIYYPRWQKTQTEATIAWDVSGYYWYLPAFLIYKDPKHQAFQQEIFNKYHPTPEFQQGFLDSATGNYVMKYSVGMSVMYLPFFTTAHLLARPLGYPADGFSPPYQLAIQIGGVLMALLGLWVLRRFLLYYYADKTVALVLLLLVFGSNYLNWAAIDVGLSHSWLFTVYALLLLQTKRFYERPSPGRAVGVGLLVGVAGLTRPTDLIACLIPLLWGLEKISMPAIREKLRFFQQHKKPLFLAVAAAVCLLLLQPLYWKFATGHWIVYSYGNGGFSFLHPHILRYTFDYTAGWLIYAPVMILAMFGIIPFLLRGANKVMVLVFALLNYYIVVSWNGWEYGSRAMIQSYPVLCILLASFITAVFRRRWTSIAVMPLFLLAVYHNIWFTYFAHAGTLWPGGRMQQVGLYDPSSMSKAYFWRVAGRWQVPNADVWKLKDTREIFEGVRKDLHLLYQNGFEGDTSFLNEQPISGAHSLQADGAHQNSRKYVILLPQNQHGWIRATATFRSTAREQEVWDMAQWHITFIKGGEYTHDEALRLHRVLGEGQTKTLTFDVKLRRGEADSLGIWLSAGRTGKTVLMDDLKVWSFKE